MAVSPIFQPNSFPVYTYPELENKKEESIEIKNLNTEITYDPPSKEISNRHWALLWKINALITAVGFIALATFTIVYTTAYHVTYLPIISLSVFALALPFSTELVKYLYNKSINYRDAADKDTLVIEQMKKIDDATFVDQLTALGVTPGTEVKNLKAIFGRYCNHIEDCKYLQQKANTIYDPLSKELSIKINKENKVVHPDEFTLDKIDFTEENIAIFKEIQQRRSARKKILQVAAACRLNAAHLLKLMQSPYETRDISSFVQLNSIDPVYVNISKRCDHGTTDLFLRKTADKKEYTVNEILEKDTTTLAREIFELPSPPAPAPALVPKKTSFFSFLS